MNAILPYTPRVKESLVIAHRISVKKGRSFVGPDALLIALLNQSQGLSDDMLKRAGVDRTDLCEKLQAAFNATP